MGRILLIFMGFMLFSACSWFAPLDESMPIDKDFNVYKNDERVLYKGNMEESAGLIAKELDEAISKIERVHGKGFTKKPVIHVCDSEECFNEYTGYPKIIVAGVGTNGLFVSPRVFRDNYYSLFLAHELSHLHMFYQISFIQAAQIPQWFLDGLATYASGGGGATFVTEEQAQDFFAAGKGIVPVAKGSYFGDKWLLNYPPASDHKFQQHMNYCQSAMFVRFLDEAGKLQLLIRAVETGDNFEKAFESVYAVPVLVKWNTFLASLSPNKVFSTDRHYCAVSAG